jgi:hypothetical protein
MLISTCITRLITESIISCHAITGSCPCTLAAAATCLRALPLVAQHALSSLAAAFSPQLVDELIL